MSLTSIHIYWYVLPLVFAISLVYSASRYESWRLIWTQALRLFGLMIGVLLACTVVLLVINTQI